LIDKKSIAVLPFVNMSNNIENEYFCDGLTEEIINALAKIKDLSVTSRTSSFYFNVSLQTNLDFSLRSVC
jgi:TolB-like protein